MSSTASSCGRSTSIDHWPSRTPHRTLSAIRSTPAIGRRLFPQFFQALNDNRSLMFMLLIMIMVVSAFVIIVTLMMMIMAKSSDVGILKTMGASDESIELIFAVEGTLIGIAGVAAGVIAGMAGLDAARVDPGSDRGGHRYRYPAREHLQRLVAALGDRSGPGDRRGEHRARALARRNAAAKPPRRATGSRRGTARRVGGCSRGARQRVDATGEQIMTGMLRSVRA